MSEHQLFHFMIAKAATLYTKEEIKKELSWLRSLNEDEFQSATISLRDAVSEDSDDLADDINATTKVALARTSTPETPAAAAAAAAAALTGETKSSATTTTSTMLMYKSSSLLTALELQHSVSPTLHAALSNARDEICGDSSDSAGGPASALHDIDHELFQTFLKKGKASVLERLRRDEDAQANFFHPRSSRK